MFLFFCLIFTKNTAINLLFFLLIVVNGIFLFFLIKVEFLSFIFALVYIGAIAILFIFALIFLRLEIKTTTKNYQLDNLLLIIVFLFKIILVFCFININIELNCLYFKQLHQTFFDFLFFNFNELNSLIFLFTTHYIFIILMGLILLVGMVGAIALCLL